MRQLLRDERNLTTAQTAELEQYRSKAEHYVCACLGRNAGPGNVRRSPGGMLYVRRWNNMQYVTSAAFLLAVYSAQLEAAGGRLHCPGGDAGPAEVMGLAESQAEYILGSNPMRISYLVGFGPKYPVRVHHRGASIVALKRSKDFIGCIQGYYDWYGRGGSNPNALTGAIVGGPDDGDWFWDDRENYMQTEACTYNTAPAVGLFAKLHYQSLSSSSSSSTSLKILKIQVKYEREKRDSMGLNELFTR